MARLASATPCRGPPRQAGAWRRASFGQLRRPARRHDLGSPPAHLAEAALSAELALVSEGTLPATLIWATYVALGPLLRRLASMGLAAAPIRTAVGPLSTFSAEANANLDELLNYGLLVARDPIETATTRLATADPADAARWLNWPACCADAWANRLRDGLTDPVAAMLSRPVPDAPPPAGMLYSRGSAWDRSVTRPALPDAAPPLPRPRRSSPRSRYGPGR